MTQPIRALFIGGPLDGDIRVAAPCDIFTFVMPPRVTLADYVDGRLALTPEELAARHPSYRYRLHDKRSSGEWVYALEN